jgi:hypothetical protein
MLLKIVGALDYRGSRTTVPGRLFEYTSVRNPAAARNARATGAESRPSTGRTDPERPLVIQRNLLFWHLKR